MLGGSWKWHENFRALSGGKKFEVLGNRRRQSQQSRLELGLRLSRGLFQANEIGRAHV